MSTRAYPTGNRFFSSLYNVEKFGGPCPMFLWDASTVYTTPADRPVTGAYRSAVPGDFAATISFSGGLTATINSVGITGNPQVTVSNFPAVTPVSGSVFIAGGSIISAVAITGAPIITLTGVQSVSVVQSVPLFVTGNFFATGNVAPSAVAITGAPIVTITGVQTVTFAAGAPPINATGIFNVNGLVNVGDVAITGSPNVVAYYPGSSTVSNSTSSGANGTALSANANRLSWFVQNTSTGALYVKFGASASAVSYNMVLKGQATSGSFDGASFTDDGARWRGIVSVFSTAPSYITWELT